MESISQMTLKEVAMMQVNQRLILQGISWDFYEQLLDEFKSSNALHFAYDNGTLEVEVPLGKHEIPIRLLADLVSNLCVEKDIEVRNVGSTTFRKRAKAKGIEPDTAFYIQNAARVSGLLDLDLIKDPPPDLAIEVDITSPSLNKMPIYAGLKISEIWLYKGKKVEFLKLVGEKYVPIKNSIALPFLTTEKATEFLQNGLKESYNKWVKDVRKWANEQ
jgi:Uma2 family endonuclease